MLFDYLNHYSYLKESIEDENIELEESEDTSDDDSEGSDMGLEESKEHPGFEAVQKKIEGEGYSEKEAGAITASASRNASTTAKRANKRLKRVK